MDDYGCVRQIIIEKSSGTTIGTRSNPTCIQDRVDEVDTIVVEFKLFDTDAISETDANTTKSQAASNPAPADPVEQPTSVADEATSQQSSPSVVVLEGDFSDQSCINQTLTLYNLTAVADASDDIMTSRDVAEQIFLINQRMLDYSSVDVMNFQAICETNGGGTMRIVNVTTLCKLNAQDENRTVMRIHYIGRNFPICSGPKCTNTSDSDAEIPEEDDISFNAVFAAVLLTSDELYDMASDSEYWTCSGAYYYVNSLQVMIVVGLVNVALLFSFQ